MKLTLVVEMPDEQFRTCDLCTLFDVHTAHFTHGRAQPGGAPIHVRGIPVGSWTIEATA